MFVYKIIDHDKFKKAKIEYEPLLEEFIEEIKKHPGLTMKAPKHVTIKGDYILTTDMSYREISLNYFLWVLMEKGIIQPIGAVINGNFIPINPNPLIKQLEMLTELHMTQIVELEQGVSSITESKTKAVIPLDVSAEDSVLKVNNGIVKVVDIVAGLVPDVKPGKHKGVLTYPQGSSILVDGLLYLKNGSKSANVVVLNSFLLSYPDIVMIGHNPLLVPTESKKEIVTKYFNKIGLNPILQTFFVMGDIRVVRGNVVVNVGQQSFKLDSVCKFKFESHKEFSYGAKVMNYFLFDSPTSLESLNGVNIVEDVKNLFRPVDLLFKGKKVEYLYCKVGEFEVPVYYHALNMVKRKEDSFFPKSHPDAIYVNPTLLLGFVINSILKQDKFVELLDIKKTTKREFKVKVPRYTWELPTSPVTISFKQKQGKLVVGIENEHGTYPFIDNIVVKGGSRVFNKLKKLVLG